MRSSRLLSVSLVAGLASGITIIACGGGGGGGGGGNHPDAAKNIDAKVFMDAPAGSGLTGLGEKCGSGQPACPTNAPSCVALATGSNTGTTAYCTPHCDDNATGKTDGSGNFPQTGSGSITPPPNNNCTTGYMGSVGSGACGVFLASTPAYTGQANTSFTGISLGCVILCGTGNTCPTGLTCDTTHFAPNAFCFPN